MVIIMCEGGAPIIIRVYIYIYNIAVIYYNRLSCRLVQKGDDPSHEDARSREPKYQVIFILLIFVYTNSCCLVGMIVKLLPVLVINCTS